MARIDPPKRRPRQQPYRRGESKTKQLYPLLQAVDQVLLDEANASARKAESNRKGAERFNRKADTVMQAMSQQAEETPFTAEAYQLAIEKQNEPAVQKWHEINTGFEAALMAQLGIDLGAPLLKAGYNWLRNKAVSPAARTMMNPENFVFNGPNIQPARINVPSLLELLISQAENFGGDLRYTLTLKPLLLLPQPKLQLGLPQYNLKADLDIASQDAGLEDVTNGDLFGIRLADTAMRPLTKVNPHDMPSYLMEHHHGKSIDRVVDNIYNRYMENVPMWEVEGINPPLPYIASIGDDSMTVGFRPQWYKMISTPSKLERMTSLAGPTRNKLIANLSPEAKTTLDARNMAHVDLFDEWLGPEARSQRQIAIDDEIAAMNKSWDERLLFDTNVNSLFDNKLITPRHRAALLNSDEPLKYFGNAVLHNIMKKAAQNYFKDIKAAKQKDYARRVMDARNLELSLNAGINDAANAVYADLQGSIKPPITMNRQIVDANNMIGQIRSIGDIVDEGLSSYNAWKESPNPAGWQLKYLMEGNKLERQISKDGNISVNAINDQVKSASDIEKYVTEKVLAENFAGLSKVNYADFKHAIQRELVSYDRKKLTRWLGYGMDRIGYHETVDVNPDWSTTIKGAKPKTYTFESSRIKEGSDKHFDTNTLGHQRTFTTDEEPDVMYMLESQSDWGLHKLHKPTKSEYDQHLADLDEQIEVAKRNRDFYQHRLETAESPDLSDVLGRDLQRDIINSLYRDKGLTMEDGYVTEHEIYLHSNWERRLIQEAMNEAARSGLTKMRFPTEDTAAKIEGYQKSVRQRTPEQEAEMRSLFEEEQQLRHENPNSPRLGEIAARMDEISANPVTMTYSPQHQTILRKYSEFPKKFKKLYRNAEVRTVTDSKGNTWYEVDVPKNQLLKEWMYGVGGAVAAGASLNPPKIQNKK